MHSLTKALAAAALAVAVGAPATASASPLQRDLDRVVAAGPPAAVVLVRDGDRTTRLAAGHARPTDRFRVGSVTKAFTATVVMQLVGEGRLSLDDTVEQHLPGLVPGGAAISVRQLLNMTAGLADYLEDDSTVWDRMLGGEWNVHWTPRQLVGLANAHPAHFAPGTSWDYCNTCYVLLGLIAEQAGGRPIADQLRDRVFTPAGLRATSFPSGPRLAGRHVHGYELLDGRHATDVSEIGQSWAWTAGAIVSTTDDVARFYRALLGGKLLAPALLRQMLTPVPIAAPFGPGTLEGYAFGLARIATPCGDVWGHDGGTPGYRTFAFSRLDGRREVVAMAAYGEDSMSPRAVKALNRVLRTAYCRTP
jgi:D-alanyl-D-alanine carboxypeptidase